MINAQVRAFSIGEIMGDGIYHILDYSSKRLIGPLTKTEVLVTCRILMQLSSLPSFDIMATEYGRKTIVTGYFQQTENGYWHYSPSEAATEN